MSAEPATSLREQQAELTRELILKALVELLQTSDAEEISVQDVARYAGVSLRTVYRYFSTRDELLVAGANWIFGMLGDVAAGQTIDDLPETVRINFRLWEEHPELARALVVSRAGRNVRQHIRERRLSAMERAVAEAAPDLSKREQREAATVLGFLQSGTTWVTMHEVGLDDDETAEAVEWALRTLVNDIGRRNKAARQTRRRKQ
jgi:AcrR family transcriptional regulator